MNNVSETASTASRLSGVKTKSMSLAIEHLPCCAFSFAAGFIGISALNHNPVLELGFAIGGAITGEYVGGKIFKSHVEKCGTKSLVKRYGISLAFGMASWGLHQQLFHDHSHGKHVEHAVSTDYKRQQHHHNHH